MYVYNVITPFILSNCYFISVTVHETSKGRVIAPISHSWVKNDGSPIIRVACVILGLWLQIPS